MDPAVSSPYRYALAGMIAMAAALGIGRFVYTPILPGMMQDLGLSASDAGLIASANYLGYLLGAFAAAGRWAHERERGVVFGSLAANAVLLAAMALTASLSAFLVIRFLAGVASAFVMVFLSAIVFSRLAAAGRNDLQALHFGGVGLGIALSALAVGAARMAGADWRAGWMFSALASAIGLIAVAPLLRDGPLRGSSADGEPRLPRRIALYKVIAAYGIFGFGYIVTATFLVAIVRQEHGGSSFEMLAWLVTGLAGLPSLFFWNAVARRFGLMNAFAVGCVCEAAGVVFSVSFHGSVAPLLAGFLFGGTFLAVTAIGLHAGRLLALDAPRRALALMTAAFGTGQIVGPLAAGFLADRTGSFFAGSMVAAAALAICCLIAFSERRTGELTRAAAK